MDQWLAVMFYLRRRCSTEPGRLARVRQMDAAVHRERLRSVGVLSDGFGKPSAIAHQLTFPDSMFRTGPNPITCQELPLPCAEYWKYCADGAAQDDSPLYLFDNNFGAAAPQLARDYTVPE